MDGKIQISNEELINIIIKLDELKLQLEQLKGE